jgi:hypothetical protein
MLKKSTQKPPSVTWDVTPVGTVCYSCKTCGRNTKTIRSPFLPRIARSGLSILKKTSPPPSPRAIYIDITYQTHYTRAHSRDLGCILQHDRDG